MAADQPNRKLFKYTDDNGANWSKMGQIDAACNAIDAGQVFDPIDPVFPRENRRWHTRKAVFQDPTTLRTKTCVIYQPAAMLAIVPGTTLAVHVQGEAAAVTYVLSDLKGERVPISKASRNDADHA